MEQELFYHNENNFYQVSCKEVNLHRQSSDNFDFEFFHRNSNGSYHVTCKLLLHPSIVNILNKKFYGIDFDENLLKQKYILTRQQKLNLKSSLEEVFPISNAFNFTTNASTDQASIQATTIRLFYRPPNDENFYHVTCIQDNLQIHDATYDYEFFYQSLNASYHVTCKVLSHSLIVNLLNKEVYGIDFDVNELNRKHVLTTPQKFNLEQNLNFYLFSFIP